MSAIFLPRAMRIGGGALNELPAALAQLGLKAPAILTDGFLGSNGALDRLFADAGIDARAYRDVIADPTVTSVNIAVDFVIAGNHHCIIGFGRGSPIDTSKAVAVLAARGGTMRECKAPHQEDEPGFPVIAIPTTTGTGSEATRFTIITDETNDDKMLVLVLPICPCWRLSITNSP